LKDHAVAEPMLVDQFQLQPHTIREEPFSGADNRGADEHLNLVNKTSEISLLSQSFLSLFLVTKRNSS